MRSSVLISFLGISMAMAAAMVGCSDDEDDDSAAPATPLGAEGESCTARADCASGLQCIYNVCTKGGSPSSGGSGGTSGESGAPGTGGSGARPSTGGSAGTAPGTGGTGVAPVLSGDGESCTRRADCEQGLGCYNQRCSPAPMGEGGEGNVPAPVLGGPGETCVLTSDCSEGLACLPSRTGASVGVCTPADSGIEPTGKTCAAECTASTDCCELPLEVHGALGVKSCFELGEKLMGVDCSLASGTVNSAPCFAMATYCNCASNVWACTDGACVYRPDCTATGFVVGGCPPYTRSGHGLTTACDIVSGSCGPAPGTNYCDTDDDCTNKPVTDDSVDICSGTECTCFNHAQCLRKCADNLDCAAGKVCDGTQHVCILQGTCLDGPEGDVTCARALGDYRATCANGTCTLPCESDLDCSTGGLVNGALTLICDTDKTCKPIGCSSDEECSNPIDVATPNTARRMFCTTPPAAGTTVSASSAITG